MSKVIELQDDDRARAVIYPELGGWLTQYSRRLPTLGWVEALHFDDAVIDRYPQQMWAGSPVLFPHVSYNVAEGQLGSYLLNGKTYESPQHGFGRRVPWRVLEQTPRSVSLELVDSERTRPSYPFSFRHQLTFRLVDGRLEWEQLIENRDVQPLPFSTGFHPYFRVPLAGRDRNSCVVRLPRARRFHPVDQAGSFFDEPFRAQDLSVATDVSETIFLGDLGRQEVVLRDEPGRVEARLNFESSRAYRFLALWAPDPAAEFYCIEPWTALPNSFGRSDGELVVLAPGDAFRATLWMDLSEIAFGL